MTIHTRITFSNLGHFQETEENFEMRYYTVLWKLCMADLNNV